MIKCSICVPIYKQILHFILRDIWSNSHAVSERLAACCSSTWDQTVIVKPRGKFAESADCCICLNSIPLWEWTWYYCIVYVRQDFNVRKTAKRRGWKRCRACRIPLWCHVHFGSGIKFIGSIHIVVIWELTWIHTRMLAFFQRWAMSCRVSIQTKTPLLSDKRSCRAFSDDQ